MSSTPRTGNRSLCFAPSDIYPCKDGHVVITCSSQKFLVELRQALERDRVGDPRFETVDVRKQNEIGRLADAEIVGTRDRIERAGGG